MKKKVEVQKPGPKQSAFGRQKTDKRPKRLNAQHTLIQYSSATGGIKITTSLIMISNIINEMSTEDLQYLKSKLESLSREMSVEIARDTQRLENKMSKQDDNDSEVQTAQNNLDAALATLNTLIQLGATAEQQASQQAVVDSMQIIFDRVNASVGNITDYEAQLLINEINTQQLSRDLNNNLLEEVNALIADSA